MTDLIKQPGRAGPRSRTAGLAWTYVPSLALALGGLAVSISASLAPRDLQTVTAVFAPWWDAERVFLSAASAGTIVGVGPSSFLVTVHDAGRNLGERLRAAGAVAIINPTNTALCGTKTARQ